MSETENGRLPAASPTPGGPAPAELRFHRRLVRQLIGAIATLALIGGLSAGGVAAAASASTTPLAVQERGVVDADTQAAVEALLASLEAEQLAWLTEVATGLPLGTLDAGQRMQVLAIVRTLLSEEGYAQLLAVMNADDALDAAAGGGTAWSTDAYTLTLLWDAASDSLFLQFAGSQLAISAILADGVLVVEPEILDA